MPDIQEVKNTIDSYLESFKEEDRFVEVAFFGGNFTGLPEKMQDDFLKIVQPYLEKGVEDERPSVEERVRVAKMHLNDSLNYKDDHYAVIEMRKHWGLYFKGFPNFKPFKMRLMEVMTVAEVSEILDEIQNYY